MALIQLAHASGSVAVRHTPLGAARRVPRRELVAGVTAFLHDNIHEPLTVAELSRQAGVSERTLRAAFRAVLGLSPKQYAIAQRLHAVHDALCDADPSRTTVTDVAMSYGFFELGRFAGRYRHAFGEVPSRTLRHAAAASSWPEQAA
jgi:transcriptional regulator GlxA family with amidase domain